MPKTDKKFLFDLNNFDEDFPAKKKKEEDTPPPAPVFSEEDIEKAKAKAFEQGRQAAMEEAKNSYEQHIQTVMNTISANFLEIMAAEKNREKMFESESIRLAMLLVQKLFPSLNEKLGDEEIKKAIEKSLRETSDEDEITIEVPEDSLETIQNFVTEKLQNSPNSQRIKILASPDINTGNCNIFWKNGGATRNFDTAIAKIQNHLEELLLTEPATNPPLIETDNDENNTGDNPPENNNNMDNTPTDTIDTINENSDNASMEAGESESDSKELTAEN